MTNRTRQRAKERAKERAKRRQRIILIVVAVIAVIGTIFAIIATRPVEVEIDEELLTRYEDLPTSFSDRGFPILGNPDAPARVEEYSSFACPACANFNEDVTPGIVERVRSGEAHFVYVPVLLSTESDRAAGAALCAAEQGRFWEYHDLLFNWQQVYEATAFQTSRLVAGAEALGLNVEEFNDCRNSDRITETIDNAQAAYQQAGGRGTPTTVVNNETVSSTLSGIANAINAAMANAEPVPVEVTEEATEDVAATEEATEDMEATEEVEATEDVEATEEAEATEESADDADDEESTEEVTENAEEATEETTDEATEESTDDE